MDRSKERRWKRITMGERKMGKKARRQRRRKRSFEGEGEEAVKETMTVPGWFRDKVNKKKMFKRKREKVKKDHRGKMGNKNSKKGQEGKEDVDEEEKLVGDND